MKTVTGALTQLSGLPEGSAAPARVQRLREAAATLSQLLRQAAPKSLCPYCKGQPELQPACPACATTGYIVEGQMDTVPRELWKPHKAWKAGRVIPLEFDNPAPPAVAANDLDGW
jgi:hypothetical protein